jgi:hypothetical protein
VSAYFSFDFTIIILFSYILHYFRIFETIPLTNILDHCIFVRTPALRIKYLEYVMAENPGANQPPSNRPHNKPPRSALSTFLLLLYPEEKFVSAGMNGLITVFIHNIVMWGLEKRGEWGQSLY